MANLQYAQKRAKKLLKRLKESQRLDIDLTPATVWEIKYLLKSTKKVTKISVLVDGTFSCPGFVPSDRIPRFIISQLEAHKLIAVDSPQVAVNSPLFFVLASLEDTDKVNSCTQPTLFCWHSPDAHRSYWLFACLDTSTEMPVSGTYSVEELLSFRDTQSPRVEERLSKLAKQQPELRMYWEGYPMFIYDDGRSSFE